MSDAALSRRHRCRGVVRRHRRPGRVTARWSEPSALVGYTIGGIVGHTAAAVSWLGPLLETSPPDGDVPVLSVATYLAPFPVRSDEDLEGPLHVFGRTQGERAAQRGPKETVTRLQARLADLAERLASEDLSRIVDLRPTLPAAIRLGDFLHTRVVELIVHGDDLAASIDLRLDPPLEAAAVAVDVLVAVATTSHGHLEVLRTLSRRERTTGAVFPVL